MRAVAVIVTLLLAVAGWIAWSGSRSERREPLPAATLVTPRLVVLYAPCTVNADHLEPYAPQVVYTPELAAFARDALVFTKHQSESDQSGTAYAALLSGRQAPGHHVFSHPVKLNDAITTMTEAFADAGFEVYFWGAQGMASPRLRYAQGVPQANLSTTKLAGDDVRFAEILDRVARDSERRVLVVANFTVTHYPYADHVKALAERHPDLVERFRAGLTPKQIHDFAGLYTWNLELQKDFSNAIRRRGLSAQDVDGLARVVELLYVSNVARLDALFGGVVRAIDQRGLRDRTLVAFTADHGEVLYRDNALFPWSHDFQLAPEVLRVPLMLRGPGIEPGRADWVTRSIDVYPTLAALAGVPVHDRGVTGADLSRVVRGESPPPELLAFSHTPKVRSDIVKRAQEKWALFAGYYPDTGIEHVWVSVRSRDLVVKLRKRADGSFGHEAFDLASDPEERRDLFDADDPEQQRLARELVRYKAELVAAHDAVESGARTPEVTGREVEALRQLGYVE